MYMYMYTVFSFIIVTLHIHVLVLCCALIVVHLSSWGKAYNVHVPLLCGFVIKLFIHKCMLQKFYFDYSFASNLHIQLICSGYSSELWW